MARLHPVLAGLAVLSVVVSGCGQSSDRPPDASESSSAASDETPEASETPQTSEVIGGGSKVFADRRFVALYGHPGAAGLGALGEQGPQESAQRVTDLAESYQPYSDEPVYPSFEIIATVAGADPGPDGTYSEVTDPEDLEPLLDVAEDHDIYVVLDLQSGRDDFLSQAKIYEDLLKRPNVGLGLDPEWRLADDQEHLQQVGSVDAAEINETSKWLADLTAEHDLPQKMLIIHQFQLSMIQNREQIDTDHSDLAMVLHADGHGTTDMKQETWQTLQQDLPDDFYLAWKNFYDQDEPMLTPEQTLDVEPTP